MNSIDKSRLPRHVAIIMDGNGRWACERGLDRIEGHRAGVMRCEEIITCAVETGIDCLTLYAFSKENWQRPASEVSALMALLKKFLMEKREKMIKNGIRFNTIGDLSLLPKDVCLVLDSVASDTSNGKKMCLTIALSYGSRDEITRAVKAVVRDSLEKGRLEDDFGEEKFASYLDTAGLADPDLVIRTSGEHRISNFLLWQGAYAEYIFEECYWPDFDEGRFFSAIREFQRRERRFGKTSEQVKY